MVVTLFAVTLIEWLLPFWLVVAVIILAIFGYFLRRNTPLRQYGGSAGKTKGTDAFRALGGLRCPSNGGGTINITMPLVRLACNDTHFRVGPSLSFLGAFVPSWMFPYAVIERVEPVKGSLVGNGVRFWITGVPLVFLTSDPSRVLDALEPYGIAVGREWGKTEWRSVG